MRVDVANSKRAVGAPEISDVATTHQSGERSVVVGREHAMDTAMSARDPENLSQTTTRTDARVMIDARYLRGKSSGIGRYTRHLIDHLLRIDERLELSLITHPARPRPVDDPRVSCQTFPAVPNSLSTRFLFARSVDFRGVDLFHSPFNILPAGLDVPAVFTLHDIMWLIDPWYCTSKLWKRWVTGTFYRTLIPKSVRRASAILTVSEHSKQAIGRQFPDAAERVDVTYNGIDPFFRSIDPGQAWPLLSEWMAPKTRFVLVVGQGSPYKNHTGALQGFLRAFADDPQVYFVLVRRLKSRADGELRELLEDPRINSRAIQLDYVTGEQLRALYSMATGFLFPSLYEGFGLPAVEAMACSTPVVASNRGAVAEVCGDGAVLVDPEDPDAIAAGLRRVVYGDAFRHKMVRRAEERAERFSWRNCARRTLNTYRRILSRRP